MLAVVPWAQQSFGVAPVLWEQHGDAVAMEVVFDMAMDLLRMLAGGTRL